MLVMMEIDLHMSRQKYESITLNGLVSEHDEPRMTACITCTQSGETAHRKDISATGINGDR